MILQYRQPRQERVLFLAHEFVTECACWIAHMEWFCPLWVLVNTGVNLTLCVDLWDSIETLVTFFYTLFSLLHHFWFQSPLSGVVNESCLDWLVSKHDSKLQGTFFHYCEGKLCVKQFPVFQHNNYFKYKSLPPRLSVAPSKAWVICEGWRDCCTPIGAVCV